MRAFIPTLIQARAGAPVAPAVTVFRGLRRASADRLGEMPAVPIAELVELLERMPDLARPLVRRARLRWTMRATRGPSIARCGRPAPTEAGRDVLRGAAQPHGDLERRGAWRGGRAARGPAARRRCSSASRPRRPHSASRRRREWARQWPPHRLRRCRPAMPLRLLRLRPR